MRLLLLIGLLMQPCFLSAKQVITIGSLAYTEEYILAEVLSQLIEANTDIEVKRRFGFASSNIAFEALRKEHIDIYPEYAATACFFILKQTTLSRNKTEILTKVNTLLQNQHKMTFSNPLGFNNSFALAVRDNDERFKNIENISQLRDFQSIRIGVPHGLLERNDGYFNLVKHYKLPWTSQNVLQLDQALMYSAIQKEQIDIVSAYQTDGRIQAYSLKLLKDDLSFFYPYFVSYLYKPTVIKKFKGMKPILKMTDNLISDDEMQSLNHAVDVLKQPIPQVVSHFLHGKALLHQPQEISQFETSFFEKLDQRKDYLLEALLEHISLTLMALILSCSIAIPLGILLTQFRILSQVAFQAINTLQTIPSLALLGFLVPIIGTGIAPTLTALVLYSILPIIRNTFTGIKNIDPKYIEVSRGIGMTKRQILYYVELPLAYPFILSGIRTSTVVVIGTATLGALVGAGGLGEPIMSGIATLDSDLILMGAIPSAFLAMLADGLLNVLENRAKIQTSSN